MTATRISSIWRNPRLRIAAIVGVVVAGIGGAVAAADDRDAYHRNWHRGHGFGEITTPEGAQQQARSAARWMLRELDTTDDQRQRIQGIVDASVQDLYPLHQQHRRHHTQLLEAMSQGTPDRAEIERLRKKEIDVADVASSRLLDATLNLFEVLTPAQRTQLLNHLQERHS
jgi:Spy/CpxP family protein refolding chaperone